MLQCNSATDECAPTPSSHHRKYLQVIHDLLAFTLLPSLGLAGKLILKYERHLAQFESLQLSFIKISLSGNS